MDRIQYDNQVLAMIVPYSQHMVETIDSLEHVEEGIYRWKRVFQPTVDYVEIPVSNLQMDLELKFNSTYKMIPGVNYNGNKWGDGKEPQGFSFDGKPYSFAYHRTSVAGCTYAQNDKWGIGMFVDTKGLEDCGFACSILEKEGKTILRVLLPEQEMPVTYASKGNLIPGYSHTVLISREKPLVCTAYICVSRLEDGKAGYAKLLDLAWKKNYHIVRPWYDLGKIWELSLRFAKESLWSEKGGHSGFSIGLSRTESGFKQVPGNKYEAGWCGQNISFGVSLLYDYYWQSNQESLNKGLACLDSWLQTRLENGLAFVHFNAFLYENERDLRPIDSCNLGQMAENYLEAYEVAAACGIQKPAYREIALGICDFALNIQSADGNYPSAFNSHGEVIQRDGSTGSFLIPAILWAYAFTKDEKYLNSAKSAFNYYMNSLKQNGFTTAGALDTHCIDKESAVPLLSSAIMLYHITNDREYIKLAEYTAYYLSTWQWHHSVKFPQGSILYDYGYDTFGGTSVSTQHHHIDCYALRYVPYLIRLSELTGREIWKQRALAVWNNATIGISDGTMVVANLLRPAGSQDEGFYHTRWAVPNAVSQWLVAWPAAFRLEILRKTNFLRKTPLYNDGIRV